MGNGRVGAMVWSANGLTMQVSGVDTSQQTAFSAGLVNFKPRRRWTRARARSSNGSSLYDGMLTTSYGSDRRVTIMGAPASEVIGIHVEDARAGVSGVVVELSLWDVSTLSNSGNVPDLNTWKTVTTYADATGAGLSRGQTDANHFGYTLAATVEGAAFTTQTAAAARCASTITPSVELHDLDRLRVAPERAEQRPVAAARALLAAATGTGYATTLADQRVWWHAFWAKSFVQYARRERRRRLPGERLLPGHVHDRRRVRSAATRSTSSTASFARPPTTPSGATPTGTGTSATSTTRSWPRITPT